MNTKPWRRLKLLKTWHEVVGEAANIIKSIYSEAEIYLIGGVAENRITVDSDIDLAIVFKEKIEHGKRIDILEKIWEKLEEKIPIYYPLHIIILDQEEFNKFKGSKKRIK